MFMSLKKTGDGRIIFSVRGFPWQVEVIKRQKLFIKCQGMNEEEPLLIESNWRVIREIKEQNLNNGKSL
jgi:hypothetical protein